MDYQRKQHPIDLRGNGLANYMRGASAQLQEFSTQVAETQHTFRHMTSHMQAVKECSACGMTAKHDTNDYICTICRAEEWWLEYKETQCVTNK